jgi:hypothetical protein
MGGPFDPGDAAAQHKDIHNYLIQCSQVQVLTIPVLAIQQVPVAQSWKDRIGNQDWSWYGLSHTSKNNPLPGCAETFLF